MGAEKEFLNRALKPALETLEQEELTEEEAKRVLQADIEALLEPSLDYSEEIDFNNENDIPKDFQIARKAVMMTLDRSMKISDLAMQALAVDQTNAVYLQLAQETNKTIQQSVKTLTDLHNSFQKIIGQKKKNEAIVSDDKKEEENVPEGLMVNPSELLKELKK